METALPQDRREDAIVLSKAFVSFAKEDYSSVLNILRDRNPRGIYYKIRFKLLIISASYESLDNQETIIDQCNALETFARRTKELSISSKSSLLNFSKIVKQVIFEKLSKREILKELNRCEAVFFKSWLLEKIKFL